MLTAFLMQKNLHVCKTFCIFAVVEILFPPFYIYVKMHVPPRFQRRRHFFWAKHLHDCKLFPTFAVNFQAAFFVF